MRRWLILVALLVALPATAAEAQPVRDGKKLLSCPDPSVVDANVGGYRYYMACTSDTAANVFPLRESNDLVHWKQIGSVFTKRNQPWWARHTPREGHYWAPALYRIGNRWVLYFAAQHDPRRLSLHYPGGGTVAGSNMLIGVATARSLHGPWRSRVLHFRGQFNAVTREQEYYRDGWFYLFYSGASTWTGSYAIGVAASQDPLVSQFQRLDSRPALRSGNGYVGPGGSSAPVLGPDGRTYIFYHAMTHPDPDHDSAARYLFSSPIRWEGLGDYDPVIGSGQVDLRTAVAALQR